MLATRDDVINCYRFILGRDAEDDLVIIAQLADTPSVWQLVERFCSSAEYRKKTLALTLAKCDGAYLLKSLDVKARQVCFLHHHSFVASTLNLQVIEYLREGARYPLCLNMPGARSRDIAVYVQYPRLYFAEGELELTIDYRGGQVFIMSFSFVPEKMFGGHEGTAILITRMQGELHKKTEIKQAAAEALGTSPQLMLYSTLTGIAKRCNIRMIYGTSAQNQICNTPENHSSMLNAYDLFYLSLRAELLDCGVFRMDLSRLDKAATEVTATKRRRHRLRRELRNSFSYASASSWVQIASTV